MSPAVGCKICRVRWFPGPHSWGTLLPVCRTKLRTSAHHGLDSAFPIAEGIRDAPLLLGATGGGISVNPRLIAVLMLLACLLGIVQPALACAPPSDCCSPGCAGQPLPGSGWVEMSRCCAIQAPVAASFSIAPQSRQALNVTGGFPALITLADDPLRLVPTLDMRAGHAATTLRAGQSLTYLRTARLRL